MLRLGYRFMTLPLWKKWCMLLAVAIGLSAAGESFAADEAVKSSVVKIYSVYADYNYSQPWQKKKQKEASGSGCIIEGKRILTNAHVVSNHTFLQVKRSDQSKKYNARVHIVAHECDLAVLHVDDESFFDGTKPIALSELPGIRERVAVYGFPEGGDELSITEGVVSRIEHVRYAHSGAYLMACQIDAAINSGNSGGPVIKDGRIVGVAFQTSAGGENIGYMISTPVIRHFLADIGDGRYDGIPDLGLTIQNMENPDLRKFYRMSDRQTGVLIARINAFSSAKGVLQEGDVLLSLNAFSIGNDGSVAFRKGERTSLLYAVQNQYISDKIPAVILRNGTIRKITIRLFQTMQSMRLVPCEQYDTPPVYYIAGGMIFEPLTKNYLLEWGDKWYDEGPTLLLNYYFNGRKTPARKEIVVLVRVLADEINVGYHNYTNKVVSKINHRSVGDLKEIIAAIENHQGKYHVIETEDGATIVVLKQHVQQYSTRILQRYQIPSDRSSGLLR